MKDLAPGRLNLEVPKMLLSGHVLLQINNPVRRVQILLHREGCALEKFALGAGCCRYGFEEESQEKDTRKSG